MRIAICAIAVWSFLSQPALGQVASTRLSLAEARALARERSPMLRAAREAVAAAEGRERQAGAFPNPSLAYGREQTSRSGERNLQNTLTLEQRLEVGGQRGARREAAKHLKRAAESRYQGAAAELDAQVARAYTGSVSAQRRALVADQAALAFGRALRKSEARLARGDISGFAHRRLGLEVARYEGLKLAAFLERDSSTTVLRGLLGLASSDSVPLLGDILPLIPLSLTVDSLVQRAVAGRPDLLAAAFEAEAALAQARVALAERVPTPSISAGFKNERVTTGETLSGFVAGIAIPLPLWDRRSGSVAASEAEARRSATEVELLRQSTAVEVRNAFAADATLGSQLVALRQRLGPEATSARQAADAAYDEGEITLLEWLDTVRAYYEAETMYLDLWAEHARRRAALEQLAGIPLF